MSHKATNWLATITPSLITSGEFRVLFQLCDCHNPSHGCFPNQEWLRARTGLSNGGLNKCLAGLELKGIIQRKIRFDPVSKQRKSTLYVLGCDAKLEAKPAPQSGEGANSTLDAKPSPLYAQSHLHPSGDKPVIEPVIELVSKKQTKKKIHFEVFWELWPNKVAKPKANAAWDKLSATDQAIIISLHDAGFTAWREVSPATNPIHPATFLNNRRWEDSPASNGGQNGNGSFNQNRNAGASGAHAQLIAGFAANAERYRTEDDADGVEPFSAGAPRLATGGGG